MYLGLEKFPPGLKNVDVNGTPAVPRGPYRYVTGYWSIGRVKRVRLAGSYMMPKPPESFVSRMNLGDQAIPKRGEVFQFRTRLSQSHRTPASTSTSSRTRQASWT